MEYKGECHCKSIKFTLITELEKIVQCNCSFCKRRNAKMVAEPKDAIKITEGSDHLTLYQFGSNVAKHHFCNKCGIFIYSNRKSDPNGIAVNLGCVDDVDTFEIDSTLLNNK